MKKKTMTCSILAAIILLVACETKSDLSKSYSDGDCVAPSRWFEKTVDGMHVTNGPKEGAHSVFAKDAKNCDFHKWSWQKFLWLTSNNSGHPLFMDSLFQVTTSLEKVKSTDKRIILTDIRQATGDVLHTYKGFSSQQNVNDTVYYSIHVNDLLYNTIKKYGTYSSIDEIKDVTYPVGSLESKISWVNVNTLKDTSSYFITNGQINGENVRIAFLGMHVVGIVENHPEFIWATFEHDNLAPFYD